jgi:alkylation response protein AidB-like acyl-CoA dehydrogenase
MATIALMASDDADAKAQWLPRIASGDALATLAVGEKIGEWDAARLEATAENGTISGEKPLVPYAAASDVILVAAPRRRRTRPVAGRTRRRRD